MPPFPTHAGPVLLVVTQTLNDVTQTLNDEPQPQVVRAFGFFNTNCAPCSPS